MRAPIAALLVLAPSLVATWSCLGGDDNAPPAAAADASIPSVDSSLPGVDAGGDAHPGPAGDDAGSDAPTGANDAGTDAPSTGGDSGALVGVTQMSTYGGQFSIAVASGQWVAWGDDQYGQAGIGVANTTLGKATLGGDGSHVQRIATGTSHACAIFDDAGVACWGNNALGKLGHDPSLDGDAGCAPCEVTPYPVSGVAATSVSANRSGACVVTPTGGVTCWGGNSAGELGTGTADNNPHAPAAVAGVAGATQVATGVDHYCAIIAGGAVTCWGSNFRGETGRAPSTCATCTPLPVAGITGATALGLGDSVSCAVLSNGTVECWGSNGGGTLGGGPDANIHATPTAVPGVTNAKELYTSGGFTCALLADGTVTCWGDNTWGEMGHDPNTDSQCDAGCNWGPHAVAGLSGVTHIGGGIDAMCALMSDTRVLCWGDNHKGQLGDNGAEAQRFTPQPVLR
jgi:alpha-tubulin suppressor-like RCC1 family protein